MNTVEVQCIDCKEWSEFTYELGELFFGLKNPACSHCKSNRLDYHTTITKGQRK